MTKNTAAKQHVLRLFLSFVFVVRFGFNCEKLSIRFNHNEVHNLTAVAIEMEIVCGCDSCYAEDIKLRWPGIRSTWSDQQ